MTVVGKGFSVPRPPEDQHAGINTIEAGKTVTVEAGKNMISHGLCLDGELCLDGYLVLEV